MEGAAMIQWDDRQNISGEEGTPLGAAPLTGKGVLRRGRKEVAQVTYIVRTVTRGNPETGQYAPQYGGRIDVLETTAGEDEWSQADDLVLHLLPHQLHLGVALRGKGPAYTLHGQGALIPEKSR
jgi:hypothetical protein